MEIPKARKGKSMRILIADDDDACRKIMYRFLLPIGNCDTCADGTEAVEAMQKGLDSNTFYDLICLDIHMPNMDGHMAAARIREMEEARGITAAQRAKIMVVTALGDTVNLTNAFDAACDAYIVKPFTHAKLMEQLYFMGLIEKPAETAKSG